MIRDCADCGCRFRTVSSPRCPLCRMIHRRQVWRACAAAKRGTPAAPRACRDCGTDIRHRGPAAVRCEPCVEAERRRADREQAHARRALHSKASYGGPRDLALEARIDAHLACIRAARTCRITDEIAWAHPVDLVAEAAQDYSGIGQMRREGGKVRHDKAKRLAEAERRAARAS